MAWDGVELSFPQLSMIYEDDTKKWYSKRTYGSKSYRTHTNSGPDSSTRPPIENSIRIPIQKLSSKIKDLL